MAKFYQGQIVRNGLSVRPLRVVDAFDGLRQTFSEVVPCGEGSHRRQRIPNCDLDLVRDPVRELMGCVGWQEMLNGTDKLWLQRQLHATAAPLPWLTEDTQKGNQMTKLYQTKEEIPRFGTLLATNSAGKLVLEMKGTGEVLTFAKKDVEEVKPYTVRIRFIENDRGTMYEYLSRPGDVEVGDILFVKPDMNMARVLAVNTKSDKATTELAGRKVVTAAFGADITE